MVNSFFVVLAIVFTAWSAVLIIGIYCNNYDRDED